MGWLFERVDTNTERFAPTCSPTAICESSTGCYLWMVLSIGLPTALGGLITWSWWGAVTALFWAGLVRVSVLHHVTWSINSICHMIGQRPFASRDKAANFWPLAILSMGESWHNSHHAHRPDMTTARPPHGAEHMFDTVRAAGRREDAMSNTRVGQILSRIADGRASDTSLPARLCAECLAAVPVSGVALALMTDDGPSGVVLAATDEQARQLEELQFAVDEGPCVEASRSDHPVLHPELTTTGSVRWPRYGAAALDAGVHAIFAFPLRVGAIRLGVLDLYRDTPGNLTAGELADGLAFADAATVLLLYLQDHPGPDGVSLTDALLRLRDHAYDSGQTVTGVAVDVVSRRLHFDDSESPGGSDGATADR